MLQAGAHLAAQVARTSRIAGRSNCIRLAMVRQIKPRSTMPATVCSHSLPMPGPEHISEMRHATVAIDTCKKNESGADF